jgi:hypothetical protein
MYELDQMDLREIGWEGVARIDLAQCRDHWKTFVNTMMKLQVLVPQSYFQFVSLY